MKTGIVFEGGANRTVFSLGVMDALLEEGIKTDYMAGSSAGIAYGVNFASAQKGRGIEIFDKYVNDKRYMGARHMLNRHNRCYFNLDFTYREVPNELVYFDFDKYGEYPQVPEASATNMITGKADYLKVDSSDRKFMALRATCALPFLFPIIKINGVPYMDGGLSDPVPYKRAIEMGCDKLILVLTRERGYKKGPEKLQWLLKILYNDYPEFIGVIKRRADLYNLQRKEILKLEKQGKVFVIMPESSKNFSRTEKNLEKIHKMYDDGYNKMINRMEELKKYLSS